VVQLKALLILFVWLKAAPPKQRLVVCVQNMEQMANNILAFAATLMATKVVI